MNDFEGAGMYYILEGKVAVVCEGLMEWGRWMETAERVVARTFIGDRVVSTVFLGVDHQWGNGPPILYETMVFKNAQSEELQDRCSTWEQAETMHELMCNRVREAQGDLGL